MSVGFSLFLLPEAAAVAPVKDHFGDDARTRTRLGLPPSACPWTGRPGVQMLGVRLPRKVELVDLCWAMQMQSQPTTHPDILKKELFVNLGQSVQRAPISRGAMPCMATSTEVYSFEHDMTLSAEAERSKSWDGRHSGLPGPTSETPRFMT